MNPLSYHHCLDDFDYHPPDTMSASLGPTFPPGCSLFLRHLFRGGVDLDRQIEQLKRCEIIKENEVKALCAKAREILVEEGNVQRVDSPVTVSSIR
ncbi:hypothetical protein pipiens_018242, partial [Culex pipiens pipiens]